MACDGTPPDTASCLNPPGNGARRHGGMDAVYGVGSSAPARSGRSRSCSRSSSPTRRGATAPHSVSREGTHASIDVVPKSLQRGESIFVLLPGSPIFSMRLAHPRRPRRVLASFADHRTQRSARSPERRGLDPAPLDPSPDFPDPPWARRRPLRPFSRPIHPARGDRLRPPGLRASWHEPRRGCRAAS